MPTQIFVRNAASVIFLLGSTVTFADMAEKSLSVQVGAGYSDNISKQALDKKNEFIAGAGIDFTLRKDTRRLSINTTADLEYLDYQTNLYDGLIGNFSGLANVQLVPERFEWVFQDNFGQVLSDPFAPSTPDNRQNINYFTTGPGFAIGLGTNNKATLSGRYSKVTYGSSSIGNTYIDNDQYSAALGFLHDLSAASQISLNVQSDKINYSNSSTGVDYDQQQAFLRYQLKGPRTQLTTDAGYMTINKPAADDSSELLRISVERKATPHSTVSLHLGYEFSNAGNLFRLQQGLQGGTLQPQNSAQTTNPFVSKYATAGWQLIYPRTSIGITASYFDESYREQIQSDQTRTNGSINFSRAITPNLRLLLTENYSKADPKQPSISVSGYHEWDSTAGLSWQLGRHLSTNLQYDHYDRSSDSQVGSYHENRVWLRFIYRILPE